MRVGGGLVSRIFFCFDGGCLWVSDWVLIKNVFSVKNFCVWVGFGFGFY